MTDDATGPSAGASDAGPQRGQLWGRYTLVEPLGSGGMGTVWAAHDPELDREVALKVLHDELLARASQERLRDEARAMARLAHPNVVAVYDVGEHRGRTYYTMELVRGRSVKDWLASPRSWREVVRVFADAARGLAAIHAAGLVHRDVKPGNVMLGDDGRVRVADLGLAIGDAGDGALAATTTLTRAGTPAYMAPEQLRGAAGDAASDQFAFGVSLWEALHGALPFGSTELAPRLAEVAAGPTAVRDVPRWLDAAVRRALASEPARRYADTAELARVLERPARRVWPWLLAGAAALALATAVVVVRRGSDDVDPCRPERDLAGLWDAAAKQRLAEPFPAASWREVERTVDRYAADWRAGAAEACRIPEAPRAACFAQRLAELRALVGSLAGLDGAARRDAPELARSLSPTADCADPAYLASLSVPTDPSRDAVRAELRVGRPDLGRAARTAEAARATGDATLEAEALLALGRAQPDEAAVETYLRAAAIGDPKTKLEAWTRASRAVLRLGRSAEAGRLLDAAEAALRTALDPLREAGVAGARGALLADRRSDAAAVERFTRAIALYETAFGGASTAQSADLRELAAVLRRLGRKSDALAALERVLAVDIAGYGADDAEVARDHQQIGVLDGELGRYDAALAALERAYAIARGRRSGELASIEADLAVARWRLDDPSGAIDVLRDAVAIAAERAPDETEPLDRRVQLATMLAASGRAGDAVPELRAVVAARGRRGDGAGVVAADELALGETLGYLGRLDEATAVLERARTALVASSGERSLIVARAHAVLAGVERARGRHAAALALDERAMSIRGELSPDGSEFFASLLAVAEDQLALGQAARAVPSAEAALAHYEREHGPTPLLAEARWVVARAAWDSGAHDNRAVKLASTVRAFAKLPTVAMRVAPAEVDAWLATHKP